MVQNEDVRKSFARRLKEALAQAGFAEWGAGARLAGITGATAKAASKWINAESMPGRANMLTIAEWLGVRVEWLQYGEGDMRPSPQQSDDISARAAEQAPAIGSAPRKYQNDLYEAAPADQRKAVDEIAEKMLALTPEQALKLKQAMDLLMPSNEPRKD